MILPTATVAARLWAALPFTRTHAMTDPQSTQETLPDGAIRVCVAGVCGIVSSWHLVPGKVAQLRRLVVGRRPPTV